jgi:excinuclease UvrABC helicase subunit UvrB
MERRVTSGERDTVLLGATGTGKTATVAWLAERVQRPVLVMLPNKTLAAQFANELREMLPNNAVEYFVSYYDYYQPEAYIPRTDTYIEKDTLVNDDIERLRHSAMQSLLTRRDVLVVASVSCIYGLGDPEEYGQNSVSLRVGEVYKRDKILRYSPTSTTSATTTTRRRASSVCAAIARVHLPLVSPCASRSGATSWSALPSRPAHGEVLADRNSVDHPARYFVTSHRSSRRRCTHRR